MPIPMVIEKLLTEMDAYLEQSSNDASIYFSERKINHQVFKGIMLDMSPDVCRMIYKNMVIEMLRDELPVCFRYGLMVAAIPIRRVNNRIMLIIHLGIAFPDVRHETRQDEGTKMV